MCLASLVLIHQDLSPHLNMNLVTLCNIRMLQSVNPSIAPTLANMCQSFVINVSKDQAYQMTSSDTSFVEFIEEESIN